MASSLIVRLRAAAGAFQPLTDLLGSGANIRIYEMQLKQGSVIPAMTLQVISDPPVYAVNRRMATSFDRVQATIFGLPPDGENARAVQSAWIEFLDQFNGDGITGRSQSPNQVVGSRTFGLVQTNPLTFQIAVDAQIFNNELL